MLLRESGCITRIYQTKPVVKEQAAPAGVWELRAEHTAAPGSATRLVPHCMAPLGRHSHIHPCRLHRSHSPRCWGRLPRTSCCSCAPTLVLFMVRLTVRVWCSSGRPTAPPNLDQLVLGQDAVVHVVQVVEKRNHLPGGKAGVGGVTAREVGIQGGKRLQQWRWLGSRRTREQGRVGVRTEQHPKFSQRTLAQAQPSNQVAWAKGGTGNFATYRYERPRYAPVAHIFVFATTRSKEPTSYRPPRTTHLYRTMSAYSSVTQS